MGFCAKGFTAAQKELSVTKKGILMEKLWCFSSSLVWWVEKVRKGGNKNIMELNILSDAGWMQIQAGLWERAAVWGTELPFSAPLFHPFPPLQYWSSSCWSLPALHRLEGEAGQTPSHLSLPLVLLWSRQAQAWQHLDLFPFRWFRTALWAQMFFVLWLSVGFGSQIPLQISALSLVAFLSDRAPFNLSSCLREAHHISPWTQMENGRGPLPFSFFKRNDSGIPHKGWISLMKQSMAEDLRGNWKSSQVWD